MADYNNLILAGKTPAATYQYLVLHTGSYFVNAQGNIISTAGGAIQTSSVFLTVSSKGIVNGSSSIFNDGANFGPDTVGTTTYGIQEAIDSFFEGDLTSRFAGGGTIFLGPGVYYCTGNITIPSAGAFNLQMIGVGKTATLLDYTGNQASFITTSTANVVGPPGNSSLQIEMRSMGLIAPKDNQVILANLYSLNEAIIDDVLFCPEEVLDNGGNCLNYTPGAIDRFTQTGIEGLRTSGDNMVRVKNSAFWCCARGFTHLGDHARVDNCIFDGVSIEHSSYNFSYDGTYVFPSSYCLMTEGDMLVNGCHFDLTTVEGYPLYADRGYLQAENCVFENCDNSTLVNFTNNTSRVVNSNPMIFHNNIFFPFDYQIDTLGNIALHTGSKSIHMIPPYAGYLDTASPKMVIGGVYQWLVPTITKITGSDVSTSTTSFSLGNLLPTTIFSVTPDQGGAYEFEAVLNMSASADTNGIKFAVYASNGFRSLLAHVNGSTTTSSMASDVIINSLTGTTNNYLIQSNQNSPVTIKGIVDLGTTGTFKILHAKNTSGTSTAKTGSYLKYRRIS